MRILVALALVAALSPLAWAKGAKNPQQEKMKACNQQASEKKLKGDEHAVFMKECLGSDVVVEKKLSPQQQRMKDCNAQAREKALKGQERKDFMKQCLKKKE